MNTKFLIVSFFVDFVSRAHGQLGSFVLQKVQTYFEENLPQINLSLPIPTTVNPNVLNGESQAFTTQSEFWTSKNEENKSDDKATLDRMKTTRNRFFAVSTASTTNFVKTEFRATHEPVNSANFKTPPDVETAEFLLPSASTDFAVPVLMKYHATENHSKSVSNYVDRPIALPNDNVVRTEIQEAIKTGELSARDYLKTVPRMRYSDVLAEEIALIRENKS